MDSHLVSIEIGIEGCTYEWVKLYSLTTYKHWLKCLDSKSVKCRGTVKHNRMLLDDILKNVPNLWLKLLYHLLCLLDIVCLTCSCKLLHNKWLEQLDSHLLRETALVNLKLWSNYDN